MLVNKGAQMIILENLRQSYPAESGRTGGISEIDEPSDDAARIAAAIMAMINIDCQAIHMAAIRKRCCAYSTHSSPTSFVPAMGQKGDDVLKAA